MAGEFRGLTEYGSYVKPQWGPEAGTPYPLRICADGLRGSLGVLAFRCPRDHDRFERSPTSGCCSVRKPGRDLLLLRYHEHAGAHKGDPWERLRHHHSAVERENIESGRATYRVTVKVDGISAPKAGVGHTILIPSV